MPVIGTPVERPYPDVGAHLALMLPQPVQELPALEAVPVLNARIV